MLAQNVSSRQHLRIAAPGPLGGHVSPPPRTCQLRLSRCGAARSRFTLRTLFFTMSCRSVGCALGVVVQPPLSHAASRRVARASLQRMAVKCFRASSAEARHSTGPPALPRSDSLSGGLWLHLPRPHRPLGNPLPVVGPLSVRRSSPGLAPSDAAWLLNSLPPSDSQESSPWA